MNNALHNIFQFILFALGFDGKLRRESVDAGICNFGGQGRNKYGK